ncbi:MAG: type I methionyl aminopeptidase [Duncaniella sp.]|nr:type I methionyl aminopeptidase [Duncaniella sp.]MDE5751920.1 type I methionyl aminopeptidase [Duncaniella sp.]MDE6327442.1 type I methionyl aminopeptidase [Duncaniella sp.]MDE6572454.1 type I methionyl aminopeptidase [Duncaniella sp.]MDE6766297.1 type I methionyl aminopeptidase [Duncaniella sp.]
MIYLKTPEEIEKMRQACTLVSRTLGEIAKWVAPGVTTRHLDNIAREFMRDNGGKPACLGYGGFPGTLCIEVNETVVHGFPSGYELREGDIVGIDTVVELDGFNGDMCYTFPVGDITPELTALCKTTKESLYKGIEAAQEGRRIGDIANAVQTYCEKRGYTVVREMCGHGIGRKMHEDPEVPNYGRRGVGPVLKKGMCICIEPMINMGSRNIVIERDGWHCRTKDRKPSAHYEHTITITPEGPEILTTFDYVEEVLGDRFI